MSYLYILEEFEYLAWVVAYLVVEMLDRKCQIVYASRRSFVK